VSFWVVASLGVVASAIAWVWYGMAQEEAQSEQSKAVSAGTSMAGFAELVGGVPLVLAHLVGLGVLLILGWRSYRKHGIILAVVAVAIASAIGILCAQLLWAGDLFELGIGNDTYVP
jgi:Sec-independent protein secretion pathway component TatC